MILVVCTDDPNLVGIAQASSTAHPAAYGAVYTIYANATPPLGVAEDLFIIAHGAYEGDDDNPVIGDAAAAFYVNAVELYMNIQGLFPAGYTGNVYIDACESADHAYDTLSFAEVFLTQVQVAHGETQVFARGGEVDGLIPPPNDAGWTEATL